MTGCGALTVAQANSWLMPAKGSFSVSAGNSPNLAEKVLFKIPTTAPPALSCID